MMSIIKLKGQYGISEDIFMISDDSSHQVRIKVCIATLKSQSQRLAELTVMLFLRIIQEEHMPLL